MEGASLLTGLLTAGSAVVPVIGVHGLGEDVRRGGLSGADYVGVDPERDGRVGVAQAGRHDMDRDAGQQ